MRYYGQHRLGKVSILRYEGISSQTAISLPLSYSNSTFVTRLDIMYLCEDSGTITVVECNTNPDLVGLTLVPGTAYMPEALFGNNIVKLQSSNTVPIFTMLQGSRSLKPRGSSLTNVDTVTVNGTFTLPANTYAAIVEGSVIIADTTVDSNTDLFIIGAKPTDTDITGNGKLITFNVEEVA